MKVTTGFGYIKDAADHIVAKYELPKGEHPLKAGYGFVELDTREELEDVTLYIKPKTQEQMREEKIQAEITAITRKMAIDSLTQKGELQ